MRLQRAIPMVGNSFKPFFIGRFDVHDGKVVLAGRFTMLAIVKVFMTFWFAVITVSAVAVLLGARPEGGKAWFFALQPLVMFGAGLALVAIGKWFARNDVAWLSRVIEGALASPGAGGSVAGRSPSEADEGTVPNPLKGMAIFLAVSGVMAVVSGLTMTYLPSLSRRASAAPPIPTLGRWGFVYAGARDCVGAAVAEMLAQRGDKADPAAGFCDIEIMRRSAACMGRGR